MPFIIFERNIWYRTVKILHLTLYRSTNAPKLKMYFLLSEIIHLSVTIDKITGI